MSNYLNANNVFKEVSIIKSKDRHIISKKTIEKYFIIYFSALIFIFILFFIEPYLHK